jgi:hypothetical protein
MIKCKSQDFTDTKWLQLESLKKFARVRKYTWGGDGAFYYFGDDNFEDDKISLKGMQMLHNKNESRNNKTVKATFLQWNKKTKNLICQKHLVKLS